MSVKFDFENEAFPFSVCEAMSEDFKEYPREKILDFNLEIYDTVQDCEDACRKNSQCLSYETWPDNNGLGCSTAPVTYDMIKTTIPTNIGQNAGDLYSRTCIEMDSMDDTNKS